MDELTKKRLEKQKQKMLNDRPAMKPVQDMIDNAMWIIDQKPWTDEKKQKMRIAVIFRMMHTQLEKALDEMKDIQRLLRDLDE